MYILYISILCVYIYDNICVRACVRVCVCAYSSALAALPNELCKIRSKKTPRNPASKTGPGTVHLRRLPFSCNDWLTCASVSDLHPLTVPSSPSETFRLSVSWMCCFCCLIVSLSHCCSRAFRIKLHTFIPPNLSPKCNLHLAWMLTPFLNRFLTGAAFERILFGGGKTSLFCMSFSANCTTSNFSNMVRRLFARGGSGRCFSSSLRTFALAPVLSRLTWFRRASTKFLVLCFSIVLATTLVRASWSLAFFLWAESDSCSYCLWEMTWRPFAFWCSSSKVCKAKKRCFRNSGGFTGYIMMSSSAWISASLSRLPSEITFSSKCRKNFPWNHSSSKKSSFSFPSISMQVASGVLIASAHVHRESAKRRTISFRSAWVQTSSVLARSLELTRLRFSSRSCFFRSAATTVSSKHRLARAILLLETMAAVAAICSALRTPFLSNRWDF